MSTIVASSLIDKLKEKQVKEILSDHKFAAKLGISYQLWQMTRTSNRDVGLSLLKATTKIYPELIPDIVFFLAGEVEIPSFPDEYYTTLPQKPQNRRPAFLWWVVDGFYSLLELLGIRRH